MIYDPWSTLRMIGIYYKLEIHSIACLNNFSEVAHTTYHYKWIYEAFNGA